MLEQVKMIAGAALFLMIGSHHVINPYVVLEVFLTVLMWAGLGLILIVGVWGVLSFPIGAAICVANTVQRFKARGQSEVGAGQLSFSEEASAQLSMASDSAGCLSSCASRPIVR